MTSAHPDKTWPENSELVFLPDDDNETRLPIAQWLSLVAGDDPVDLPRPAWQYLAEARSAGEV